MINSCRVAVWLFIISLSTPSLGQVKKKIREYEKGFQVSLFPGISTNGIYSGSYYNLFSLNLFGGFSAGTRVLEVGVISNATTKSNTGIQLAGLANIVGANAFLNLSQSEEHELISKEGFESNQKGIQVAGLLNYVRDHGKGIQVAGLLNVVGGDFRGVQLAGFGNSSGNSTQGYSAGLQLASLYNISNESIAGFQISALFNYTNGQLAGTQLGLINKARIIKGKNTLPPTKAKGFQFGLVNFSKEMDGTQVGLVNFGGAALGKQFGLINFFARYPTKEQVNKGVPVGLLNFGSKGSVFRFQMNELFLTNIEYTTGNCYNCSVAQSEMPFDARNQIFNQNALILGYDPLMDTWGFGYGFMKILYNKNSMLPTDLNNRKRVITYGIRFLHLNRDMSLDRSFNLLNRFHLEYGKRWKGHYLFVSVSVNYFLCEEESGDVYKIRSAKFDAGKAFGLSTEIWPGYGVGIQW